MQASAGVCKIIKKLKRTVTSRRKQLQRIRTTMGLEMAFATQTQSKSQYTKPSPDFSFGIILKYVWAFKTPEMVWQQIVGSESRRMQQVDVER